MFDCFVDSASGALVPWAGRLPPPPPLRALPPPGCPPASLPLVPNVESARLLHVLACLIDGGHPVMLVGPAGVGKSLLAREALRAAVARGGGDTVATTLALCSLTSAGDLQAAMEGHLEKKTGARWWVGRGARV